MRVVGRELRDVTRRVGNSGDVSAFAQIRVVVRVIRVRRDVRGRRRTGLAGNTNQQVPGLRIGRFLQSLDRFLFAGIRTRGRRY